MVENGELEVVEEAAAANEINDEAPESIGVGVGLEIVATTEAWGIHNTDLIDRSAGGEVVGTVEFVETAAGFGTIEAAGKVTAAAASKPDEVLGGDAAATLVEKDNPILAAEAREDIIGDKSHDVVDETTVLGEVALEHE